MLDDPDNPISQGTSRMRVGRGNQTSPGISRIRVDRDNPFRPLISRQIGPRISPAINRKQIVPQVLLVIDRVNRH